MVTNGWMDGMVHATEWEIGHISTPGGRGENEGECDLVEHGCEGGPALGGVHPGQQAKAREHLQEG